MRFSWRFAGIRNKTSGGRFRAAEDSVYFRFDVAFVGGDSSEMGGQPANLPSKLQDPGSRIFAVLERSRGSVYFRFLLASFVVAISSDGTGTCKPAVLITGCGGRGPGQRTESKT